MSKSMGQGGAWARFCSLTVDRNIVHPIHTYSRSVAILAQAAFQVASVMDAVNRWRNPATCRWRLLWKKLCYVLNLSEQRRKLELYCRRFTPTLNRWARLRQCEKNQVLCTHLSRPLSLYGDQYDQFRKCLDCGLRWQKNWSGVWLQEPHSRHMKLGAVVPFDD